MRVAALISLAALTQALNIVSSNDDGWAEANIRELYDVLSASGHKVVLSAPAENQSGAGSKDEPPSPRTKPCEYGSCTPAGASYGHDPTNARLNWVNSYPVTSMKYGIYKFTPALSGGKYPDLAVSGPNVGPNVGPAIPVSGTVGAASYAAHEAGIPAIAFSGWGNNSAWNATRPLSSKLDASAASTLIKHLVAQGRPFLPRNIWLNVNFPHANETGCATVNDITFVLATMEDLGPISKGCGLTRLPTEMSVVLHSGCYASVTVAVAPEKKDASAAIRQVVADKLKGLLGDFPDV